MSAITAPVTVPEVLERQTTFPEDIELLIKSRLSEFLDNYNAKLSEIERLSTTSQKVNIIKALLEYLFGSEARNFNSLITDLNDCPAQVVLKFLSQALIEYEEEYASRTYIGGLAGITYCPKLLESDSVDIEFMGITIRFSINNNVYVRGGNPGLYLNFEIITTQEIEAQEA